MDESIDLNRRRFFGRAAMTMAAARVGLLQPRALRRASSRLSAVRRGGSIRHPCRPRPCSGRSCSSSWHLYLYQLAAHASVCSRVGTEIRATVDRDRRAHTRIRFRKNLENVRRAVQQMRIDYPIAVDNDYAIWRAFDNRSGPHCTSSTRGDASVTITSVREIDHRKHHPAVADGSGRDDGRPGNRVGHCDWLRTAG